MINIEAVDRATDRCIEQGIGVLHPFMLAQTEREHVERLLELMNPPQGAVVLDAGCGVGELARLMREKRPDLQFKLLNVSAHQLSLCPPGMEQILASFDAIPLADESVDVVLFAFSICHADDWGKVLREACRVLRPGGIVFIFDYGRTAGDNTFMAPLLHAGAYRPADIVQVALNAGLELRDLADARIHQTERELLREVFDDASACDMALRGVFPLTLRLHKLPALPAIESAFRRHQRVGFQMSGGRDSMAAAWQLRPYWDRIEFYFLDTGEHFPETLEVIVAFEALLGRPVTRIAGDVAAVRQQFGLASDVVPVDNTEIGRLVSGRAVKIISRYECCARTLMNPMHARMQADGITLIVRGQRDADYATPPCRSGQVDGGMEVLYPIEEWTTEQVDDYLLEHGLPTASFYAGGMPHGSDCMGCTAWWGENRPAYLRKNHPQAYERYAANAMLLRAEIDRQRGTLEG